MRKRIIKIAALLLAALILTLSAVGCSSRKPLMTLGDTKLMHDVYTLMLSIQKGNMANSIYYYYGDYNSAAFWDKVVDENSTTNNDYYTFAIYEKAKNLVAAAALFDELGLSLPAAATDSINKGMEELINECGSKNELNAALLPYGANYDTVLEYKTLTAKAAYLASHLYGTDGSKIGVLVKEKYFKENYVAFKQILISNTFPVYVTDSEGNTVYYTETGAIAYDTTREGVRAEIVDGAFVYYNPDGTIAYDTVNGKPSPVLDSNGNQVIKQYTSEEMLKRSETAIAIKEMASERGESYFESLILEHSDTADSSSNPYYLATNVTYATIDSSMSIMDSIADKLLTMEVGDVSIVSGDDGFHIIMKYELAEGAYSDKENSTWFTDRVYGIYDFLSNLQNSLLLTKLEDYKKRISVDTDLLNSVTLRDVEPNYSYY